MTKKYLLAVDGSKNSQRAAEFMLNLLRESSRLEVTLVYVVNVRKELLTYSPLADIRDIEGLIAEKGREILDDQEIIFKNEGFTVNKVMLEGDAGYKIAEYAREGGFSQIVLGTRGLSDFKGLVMGSVSHKVVHFAHCPVTLVK
ncbi:MAG: universal stress protein [Desulfocucumaceae bacterium]